MLLCSKCKLLYLYKMLLLLVPYTRRKYQLQGPNHFLHFLQKKKLCNLLWSLSVRTFSESLLGRHASGRQEFSVFNYRFSIVHDYLYRITRMSSHLYISMTNKCIYNNVEHFLPISTKLAIIDILSVLPLYKYLR